MQLASPACLDISARASGLICREVPSFHGLVGDALLEEDAHGLRDWPDVWAVVMDFGTSEVAFAVGPPHASRAAAERAARCEVKELEEYKRQAYEEQEIAGDCSTVEEFLALGEPWAILYGPLTPKTFPVFCEMGRNSEEDFESDVLRLQDALAWELTRETALAMRHLPQAVQRCVFAFAFTTRALGHM